MNVDLLKTVCSTYGPTGRETEVADLLKKWLVSSGFNVSVDDLGNVIARMGEGVGDVFVTHIDQRSWVVEHKDKEGYLQLKPVSQGFALEPGWALDGEKNNYYISFYSETKSFHAESLLDDKGRVGDFLVPDSGFQSSERKVLAGTLSDRVGVSILIDAAKEFKKSNKPITLVFYVGRHLGFMGLTSSLKGVNIERLLIIETFANNNSFPQGGFLLPVRTQKSIPSSNISGVVSKIAVEEKIDFQKVIVSEQQSAADVLARNGIESLVLGIPLRNYGARVECLKTADYDALLKLVRRLEE